jgi:hypothetical protein
MLVQSMVYRVVGVSIAIWAVEASILPTSGGSSKATRLGVVAARVFDAIEDVEIPSETLDFARHDGLEMKNHL